MVDNGNLMSWIGVFLGLAIFGGIAALIAGAVRDGTPNPCTDASAILSGSTCVNASNVSQALGVTSAAWNASNNGLSAIVNYTAQLGSAGTIAGLTVLVLAAVIILGYFGYKRFG